MNSFKLVRKFHIELEFGSVCFEERGKPKYPDKNLSEQWREPTTNSTHVWLRRRVFNPGHIGGRGVFSPLHQPYSSTRGNQLWLRGISAVFSGLLTLRYFLKGFDFDTNRYTRIALVEYCNQHIKGHKDSYNVERTKQGHPCFPNGTVT